MDFIALHTQLAALAPAVLCGTEGGGPTPGGRAEETGAPVAEVEAHVSAGCSRCARVLVNARDAAVSLAMTAPSATPGAELRQRILDRVRRDGGLRTRTPDAKPRRFFDVAGEVARLHVGTPEDAVRTLEVDALAIASPGPDDATGRFLAQIQRLLRFPVLMVSVLRGDRTTYRAQIGLDAKARDRRRETSFCTHTVSTGEPMVVQNAGEEPFFRGSLLVVRDGVRSYVGVPLRTSRGVLTGNVCVMDYVPRRIGPATVRILELYAPAIVAEIEHGRRAGGVAGGAPELPEGGAPEPRPPRTAAGAPIHSAPWFGGLAALVEGGLGLDHGADAQPSMVVAEGPGAEALADIGKLDEPVGRLAGGRSGLLLVGPHDAEGRLVELRAALPAGSTPRLEIVRPPFAKLFQ